MPYMVLRMQGFNCMVKCTKEAEQATWPGPPIRGRV